MPFLGQLGERVREEMISRGRGEGGCSGVGMAVVRVRRREVMRRIGESMVGSR